MRALVAATVTIALASAALTILVPGVLASSEPVQPHLTIHHAVRDREGRILAWYGAQQTRGYDHVIRLAWRFIESKIPRDHRWGTGLPVQVLS